MPRQPWRFGKSRLPFHVGPHPHRGYVTGKITYLPPPCVRAGAARPRKKKEEGASLKYGVAPPLKVSRSAPTGEDARCRVAAKTESYGIDLMALTQIPNSSPHELEEAETLENDKKFRARPRRRRRAEKKDAFIFYARTGGAVPKQKSELDRKTRVARVPAKNASGSRAARVAHACAERQKKRNRGGGGG